MSGWLHKELEKVAILTILKIQSFFAPALLTRQNGWGHVTCAILANARAHVK